MSIELKDLIKSDHPDYTDDQLKSAIDKIGVSDFLSKLKELRCQIDCMIEQLESTVSTCTEPDECDMEFEFDFAPDGKIIPAAPPTSITGNTMVVDMPVVGKGTNTLSLEEVGAGIGSASPTAGMASGPILQTSLSDPGSKDAVYGLWSGTADASGKHKVNKQKVFKTPLMVRDFVKDHKWIDQLEEMPKAQ